MTSKENLMRRQSLLLLYPIKSLHLHTFAGTNYQANRPLYKHLKEHGVERNDKLFQFFC